MAKAYINIESATHIRFDAYTHPAYTKSDAVLPLTGLPGTWIVDASDDNEVANNPVTFDIGKVGKVVQVAAADVGGTPAVATLLYNDSTNAKLYTTVDTSNTLAGVITHVGPASIKFLEA